MVAEFVPFVGTPGEVWCLASAEAGEAGEQSGRRGNMLKVIQAERE